jgi:hypothetical protein
VANVRPTDPKQAALFDEITARRGKEPRNWLRFLDGDSATEHRFLLELPVVTRLMNQALDRQREAATTDLERRALDGLVVTDAELAVNCMAEGAVLLLIDDQSSGIDGFGSLGIDMICDYDHRPYLDPPLRAKLTDPKLAKKFLAQYTNERGELTTTLTDLTIEEALQANASMYVAACVRAAKDVAFVERRSFSEYDVAARFFWSTVYFNAAPMPYNRGRLSGNLGQRIAGYRPEPSLLDWFGPSKPRDLAEYEPTGLEKGFLAKVFENYAWTAEGHPLQVRYDSPLTYLLTEGFDWHRTRYAGEENALKAIYNVTWRTATFEFIRAALFPAGRSLDLSRRAGKGFPVRGRVTQQAQPLKAATVEVRTSLDAPIATLKTDAQGWFERAFEGPGHYLLKVIVDAPVIVTDSFLQKIETSVRSRGVVYESLTLRPEDRDRETTAFVQVPPPKGSMSDTTIEVEPTHVRLLRLRCHDLTGSVTSGDDTVTIRAGGEERWRGELGAGKVADLKVVKPIRFAGEAVVEVDELDLDGTWFSSVAEIGRVVASQALAGKGPQKTVLTGDGSRYELEWEVVKPEPKVES